MFQRESSCDGGRATFSSSSVQRLASLVPLRGTHSAVKDVKERRKAQAVEDPALKLARALTMFLPERLLEPREEVKRDNGLKKMHIFTPKKLAMGSARSMQERDESLSAAVPHCAGHVASQRAALAISAPPSTTPLQLVAAVPPASVPLAEAGGDAHHLAMEQAESVRATDSVAPARVAAQDQSFREKDSKAAACGAAARSVQPKDPVGESKLRQDAAAFVAARQEAPISRGKGLKRPAAAASSAPKPKKAL